MANIPKYRWTQNPLILLSYAAVVLAVLSTLTLPLLASSDSDAVNFDTFCPGFKNLYLCVGAKKSPGLRNNVLLASMAGARNARALLLNSEGISGPLPTGLGAFSNLSYVALANNKLTGPIPPSVGHLHDSLREIVLLNNQLSGCLPGELGMLSKAVVIDAGMNQLTGPIPPLFSCLSRVEQLNLAGNRLYGHVPDALCRLAGPAGRLSNLTLSGNYFVAVGPACAALIKDGGVLDVKHNCISGFPNQRPAAECAAFQSQRKTCPEEASTQVSCPAAATMHMNAAPPRDQRKTTRDYYSYVTYASLR